MITRRDAFKAFALIALTPLVPKLLAEFSQARPPAIKCIDVNYYIDCMEICFFVGVEQPYSGKEALDAVIDRVTINLRHFPIPIILIDTITTHLDPHQVIIVMVMPRNFDVAGMLGGGYRRSSINRCGHPLSRYLDVCYSKEDYIDV